MQALVEQERARASNLQDKTIWTADGSSAKAVLQSVANSGTESVGLPKCFLGM